MKRSRLFAGVLALAMTAVTIGSPMRVSSVSAAEVTEKPNFDFKITGNYTEKKISEADANVINEAFGYDSGSNTISICSADAKGYIDWDSSAIESWQVYQTEVFQPVLSRDAYGNLVVATVVTDEGRDVQKAWNMCATYQTETAGKIEHNDRYYTTFDKTEEEINSKQGWEVPSYVSDKYAGDGGLHGDYVLSKNHFCLSNVCNKGINTINSHLGIREITEWTPLNVTEQVKEQKLYKATQMNVTDAYVIRLWYTADDIPMNWINRLWQRTRVSAAIWIEDFKDVYGNSYGSVDLMEDFDAISVNTDEREFRYTDIWILPEGVYSVLTLEDVPSDNTPNTPDAPNTPDTPSDYVVDYSNAASQTVTKEDFSAMLEANKESDVIIKSNNGVTFTFAKGTMTEVDGKESYDFSTSIIDTYSDSMPSYIQKSSFVSQINFNYSGKLPAKASIRFYVGTEYAGKTLYYSLMNEDNTFAVVNTYVVDAEGYITVQQDHCSNYVVTTTQPQQEDHNGNDSTNTPSTDNGNDSTNAPSTDNGNDSTNTPSTDNGNDNTNTTKPSDNNATSPKTGDTTNSFLIIMIMIFSAGAVVYFVKKYKTA